MTREEFDIHLINESEYSDNADGGGGIPLGAL